MKQILRILFVFSISSCSTNQNDVGIFDKLFGKKERVNEQIEPIQNSEELMNADEFWDLISISKSKSSGNYEQQQAELKKELLKLSPIEILEFDNTFRTLRGQVYNWDFWAAAYIIHGGCSDDCFSDFRGWLIGQGKSTFQSAVQDISTLTQLETTNDGDWEGMGYISADAFEEKCGTEIPSGIRENTVLSGEEWDEEGDELKNRYPKLWAKYGMDEHP